MANYYIIKLSSVQHTLIFLLDISSGKSTEEKRVHGCLREKVSTVRNL